MKRIFLALLVAAIPSFAEARTITTIGGEMFRDATVVKKTAGSIRLEHREGVAEIAASELPAALQKEFGFESKAEPEQDTPAPASSPAPKKTKADISLAKWEAELAQLKETASKKSNERLDRRIIVLENRLSAAKDFIADVPEHVPADGVQPMVEALFQGKPLLGMPMTMADLVWGEAAHSYLTKSPHGLYQQWIYNKKNGRVPKLCLRNEVVTIISE